MPRRVCCQPSLQTQLQETQRLKQVVDMECQKAAAAAMHAKTLEMQLAASAAAVQDAQRAQMELQQQVRLLATIGMGPLLPTAAAVTLL